MAQNKGRDWSDIAVEAVNEVGNPTILATFAVIAAVLPMAFVGGLMGPYMRPIPIGASAAMFWSLAIAFIVTTWSSIRILRWGKKYRSLTVGQTSGLPVPGVSDSSKRNLPESQIETGLQRRPEPAGQRPAPQAHSHFEHEEDFFTRLYRRVMGPMIEKARWRYLFLGVITLLLLASMATVGLSWGKVKMLPFDNKSEF